jgi:hypothetical protein
MTALGHQRPVDTPAAVAPCPLRPKTDMRTLPRYVCFVPNADMRAPSDGVPSNSNAHLSV